MHIKQKIKPVENLKENFIKYVTAHIHDSTFIQYLFKLHGWELHSWIQTIKNEWAEHFEALLFTFIYKINIIIINPHFKFNNIKHELRIIYDNWEQKDNSNNNLFLLDESFLESVHMYHHISGHIYDTKQNDYNHFGYLKLNNINK